MNKIYILIAMLIFGNLKAEIGLYTSDSDNIRPVSDMYSILKDYIEKDGRQDILYYVHGRKKDVEVEIKRMKNIEQIYHVKVVMLHWDSYDSLFIRPLENARIAADSLHETFEAIKNAKNDFNEYFDNHKINVLAHSMGNVIMMYTAEKWYMGQKKSEPIFSNYVSVGADVPLKDHQLWLSELNIAQNKFIMINNKDAVLLSSYALDLAAHNPGEYRLGLGFNNFVAKKEKSKSNLDRKSFYVNMSNLLTFDHGYFVSKNTTVQKIFSSIFQNKFFSENKIYKFKVENNEKNLITMQRP